MTAVIKNYCLTIAEPDSYIKQPFIEYKPFSDGWVTTQEEITHVVETVEWLIKNGKRPIVTIFTTK